MKSCLVVDDSKVVRTVARKILEDLNFSVEEAADGQLACDACERDMPDVILLDSGIFIQCGLTRTLACLTRTQISHLVDRDMERSDMKKASRRGVTFSPWRLRILLARGI